MRHKFKFYVLPKRNCCCEGLNVELEVLHVWSCFIRSISKKAGSLGPHNNPNVSFITTITTSSLKPCHL